MLIKISSLLYILSFILLPQIRSIWLVVIFTLIYGTAQGLNIPTVQSLLAGLVPMERRAVFMSINGMVLRLGQTVGPFVAGLFYGFFGFKVVFYIAAVFSLSIFLFALASLK